MRDKKEIEEKARQAALRVDDPQYSGMSYEEGLCDALDWVLGADSWPSKYPGEDD